MYQDWMEKVPIFVDKDCRERNMYKKIDELERLIRDLENKEYIREQLK